MREKLIELIGEIQTYGRDNSNISAVCKTSNETLADHLLANGVVVREKGEWVYDHWCELKCSKCGALSKTEPRGEENFCPNCGADMRGAVNDGNL